MSADIDELLEGAYAAQQESAPHMPSVEIETEGKKETEIKIESLLVDISETLWILNEQIVMLNEVTKTMPETVVALKTTTEVVQEIAKELPTIVREQCLEEYKKILVNAAKNYNQLQNAIEKWQREIKKKQLGILNFVFFSAVITPVLVILNWILK